MLVGSSSSRAFLTDSQSAIVPNVIKELGKTRFRVVEYAKDQRRA